MTLRSVLLGGALVALVLVCYAPVRSAGFIWDDDKYVVENATLTAPSGPAAIWLEPGATPQYYPLVFTSFWLEHQVWGLEPFGYHMVNVGLHAAGAVCLWRLLLLLGVSGAWYAAALFAVHPVHVESVAWITERKNVLSGLFYFLAMLAYFHFRPLRSDQTRSHAWYLLALGLFVCALLSKTVTCSLPAVLVLLLWWQRGQVTRQELAYLAPFFALGLALALVTVQLEKHHVGALGAAWDFSPIDRCLIAGRALWFYAGKLVWPVELTFIYPRWHIDDTVWWQYGFPAAALIVIILLWTLRGALGRGPLVAVLIFAGTLLPALGFFNVYPMLFSFVADHFQYLASAALIALAASLTVGWATRRPVFLALLAVPLAALGTLTYLQCGIYQNAATIWLDTLTRNPDCWVAHHNLATLLFKAGRYREAAYHSAETLRLYPEQPLAQANLLSLGVLLYQEGSLDSALHAADVVLAHDARNADAYLLRGQVHARCGRKGAAEQDFRDCLRFKSDHADACYQLGVLLLSQGQSSQAEKLLARAVELQPDNASFAAALAQARDTH